MTTTDHHTQTNRTCKYVKYLYTTLIISKQSCLVLPVIDVVAVVIGKLMNTIHLVTNTLTLADESYIVACGKYRKYS